MAETPDSWAHVRELFHAAIDLPPEERPTLLAQRCAGDAVLKAEVEALLSEAGEVALGEVPHPAASHAAAEPALPGAGSRVGRHLVLRELGRGAMGVVYEARQDALGRSVALKLMHDDAELAARGVGLDVRRRLQDRFLEEAATLAQLDHPGIVPIHELDEDRAGRCYFTMRLVEGEDFGRIIQRVRQGEQGWSLQRALEVILRVCDAMAFAHARGVLHRDLKPSHILVGEFGETYIVDWGLARVEGRRDGRDIRVRSPLQTGAGRDAARHDDPPAARGDHAGAVVTMDGDAIGTPAYMAPEQARGELSRMGAHSDVYGLGAVLYHLLTGAPPYVSGPGLGGDGEHGRGAVTGQDVLERCKAGPPASIPSIERGVPAELVAVCEMAMARDVPDRYPSMAAFADDLRAFLEQRVVQAYRTGPVAELRKWCERNRALAAAAALLLLVLVAGCVTVAATETRRRHDVEDHLSEVLRLSDVALLQQLHTIGARLLPAQLEHAEDLQAWLAEAGEVAARLPRHEATLRAMRERAERPAGTLDPRSRLVNLLHSVDDAPESWTFATAEDQWQHDTLAQLITDIDSVEAPGGLVEQVRAGLAFLGDAPRGMVSLRETLELMDAGIVGPVAYLAEDRALFASLFERTTPETTIDGPAWLAAQGKPQLLVGSTLSFPAGIYALPELMRDFAAFPREVTVAGAGTDKTLLIFGDLATSGFLDRFTMRDCTVFTTGNGYLFDLRTEPAVVRMERVRVIGFDVGAGSSCAFGTKELALYATDCAFEGGYGRSPEHGTLFDVRTDGLLARFDNCRFSLIALEPGRFRPGATVVFEDCELVDMLGMDWWPTTLPEGVRLLNSPVRRLEQADAGAPHLELASLFPDWKPED